MHRRIYKTVHSLASILKNKTNDAMISDSVVNEDQDEEIEDIVNIDDNEDDDVNTPAKVEEGS